MEQIEFEKFDFGFCEMILPPFKLMQILASIGRLSNLQILFARIDTSVA